jgi:hypothetical protein
MGHQHDEHHGHGSQELSFADKGGKLLEHWIHHNIDHLGSYQRWASEFRKHQYPAIADLLESVAEQTARINATLNEAAQLLASQKIDHKS